MKKIYCYILVCLGMYSQVIAQPSNEKLAEDIATTTSSLSQIARMVELDKISAKAMTLQQAYEVISLYHRFGIINIKPAPQFNADGSVIIPPVIPRITLNKLDTLGNYVKFSYNKKEYQVSVWYNPASSPPPRMDIIQVVHNNLDVRNVAAFTRLAIFLAMEKGVVQIHHTGMRGSDRPDCHGEGRALDFVGVVFADGGTMFVGRNWASKKVLKIPDFVETAATSQWPAKSQALHFRLDTDEADSHARSFFADLYAFIQTQYQDKTSGKDDQGGTVIGSRSYIMHPDHYLSSGDSGSIGRETHQDHIHMQIGVTGKGN